MGELQNFWCEIYLSPEAPVPGADWKPPEKRVLTESLASKPGMAEMI